MKTMAASASQALANAFQVSQMAARIRSARVVCASCAAPGQGGALLI
jgi:hypothetical protein